MMVNGDKKNAWAYTLSKMPVKEKVTVPASLRVKIFSFMKFQYDLEITSKLSTKDRTQLLQSDNITVEKILLIKFERGMKMEMDSVIFLLKLCSAVRLRIEFIMTCNVPILSKIAH